MTATITPDHEYIKAVAKHLLKLADKPSDVEYVSWPAPSFLIPDELLDLWESELVRDSEGEPSVVLTYSLAPVVNEYHEPPTKAQVNAAAVAEAKVEKKTNKKPGPKPKTTLETPDGGQ